MAIDLPEVQQTLEQQKDTLRQRVKKQKDELAGAGQAINPDRSDLARQYGQQNRELLLFARAEQQLAEIEQALARLKRGNYGACIRCGQRIQPERLEVMPETRLCVKCSADVGGEFEVTGVNENLAKTGSLKKNYGGFSIQKKRRNIKPLE